MRIKIDPKDLPKVRNPVAVAVKSRNGGAHEKTHKSKRTKEKAALKKQFIEKE